MQLIILIAFVIWFFNRYEIKIVKRPKNSNRRNNYHDDYNNNRDYH